MTSYAPLDMRTAKSGPRRVLLFEYLHANPQWFESASPSMRAEGWAMLSAMVEDMAALPNVNVSVVMCSSAIAQTPLPPVVNVICNDEEADDDFVDAVMRGGPFDDVFPIAPEIDDVLQRLVSGFRRRGQHVMVPGATTMQMASDKWKCYEWLSQSGLPTVPSFRLDELSGLEFADAETWVVKPVFGAGCDGIRVSSAAALRRELQSGRLSAKVMVQPLFDGEWYSVGLIGRGSGRPPIVLPVAKQHVEWTDGRPVYSGGRLPVTLSAEVGESLNDLLRRLNALMQIDRGYVGIDLLLTQHSKQLDWLVVEINPRLCSSYLGYRKATEANLAGHILGCADHSAVEWLDSVTEFSCAAL